MLYFIICFIHIFLATTAIASIEDIKGLELSKAHQQIIQDLVAKKPIFDIKNKELKDVFDINQNSPKESKELKEYILSKNKEIYVFISFSMSKNNILELLREAKLLAKDNYIIHVVLNGFKDGSYLITAKYLQNIIKDSGYGVSIDPQCFEKYNITHVPSFVETNKESICPTNMSCPPDKYNIVKGNISINYALKLFNQKGEKL